MAVIKITMQPEGTNDYADELHPKTSADQVVGQVLFQTATGTNTYAITDAKVSEYTAGLRVTVKFTNANTGASTININSLGAKSIVKAGGTALSSGNLKANGVYTLVYDGVNFQLQGEGASGNATASDLLSGKTAVSDAGELTGTIPSKGAATITPSTVNQTIASGQYLSGTQTIQGDPNLLSANIRNGVNIFGVVGNVIDGAGMYKVASGTATTVARGGYVTMNLSFTPKILIWSAQNESQAGHTAVFVYMDPTVMYNPNSTAFDDTNTMIAEYQGTNRTISPLSGTTPTATNFKFDCFYYQSSKFTIRWIALG